MDNSVTRTLVGVPSETARTALRNILGPMADRVSTRSLSRAVLVIKAGGSAVVKTGAAAYYGMVRGKLVTKAAATDMAALVGSVANATFNVYCFFIDGGGTLTSAMGTAATTLANVVFPGINGTAAMIGFVIINPTGTGPFVGGTTALDDATVVPNAAYVDTTGPFDPTFLKD